MLIVPCFTARPGVVRHAPVADSASADDDFSCANIGRSTADSLGYAVPPQIRELLDAAAQPVPPSGQ